jgi:hypothetical protein
MWASTILIMMFKVAGGPRGKSVRRPNLQPCLVLFHQQLAPRLPYSRHTRIVLDRQGEWQSVYNNGNVVEAQASYLSILRYIAMCIKD